jgi:MFS family permease
MQATGVGLFLYLPPTDFWTLVLFVPFFGLGYGGLVVLWPLTVAHDFGTRSFGAIAGVLGTVAASFGGAVGPVIVGFMYDITNSYFYAFLSCSGLLLLGAGAAFLTTEPHPVRSPLARGYVAGH